MSKTPQLTIAAERILAALRLKRLAEIEWMLEIGKLVANVQDADNFSKWYSLHFKDSENTFAPSRRTLLNYGQTWRTFGPEGKFPTAPEILLQFDNVAMFALAECWENTREDKTISPKAVTEALRLAKAGQRINKDLVDQLFVKYPRHAVK